MQALIVDDLKLIHRQVDHILSPAGFRVVGEVSAMEAVNRARREWFDLIILDLILSQSNGLLLRKAMNDIIKYNDAGIEIRPYFVLCSAINPNTSSDNSQTQLCIAAHASGLFQHCLQKPIQREELLKTAELAKAHAKASIAPQSSPAGKGETLLRQLDELLGEIEQLRNSDVTKKARTLANSRLVSQ